MRIRSLMVLPLAATLMLPAVAQQSAPANQDENQATQSQPAQNQAQSAADPTTATRQPLEPQPREGFWGRINPFARKKYVQRQVTPIRNRVNELDELSAQNAKYIKDVDSRAQAGIKMASEKADLADQHALAASNSAQAANQTAQQASNRIQTVEQVVTNYDQYHPTSQTEIRFRPGQTMLSAKAKQALDDIANSVQGQTNYIIEVQGFAPGRGSAAVQNSQHMADAVVRYFVINHNIPVYKVFTLALGNAQVQAASEETGTKSVRPYRGPRVDVSVLKNASVEQLNQQAMATPQQSMNMQQNAPATQGNNSGISYGQTKPSAQQPSPESQPQ